VKRAGLGVQLLHDYYAQRWGVGGVIIRRVSEGGPAANAGLSSLIVDRRGNVVRFDTITGIDEHEVRNFNDLYQALDGRKPGEKVTVRFMRDGTIHTTSLKLTELN
jgi:S1-C subfamily serine protease